MRIYQSHRGYVRSHELELFEIHGVCIERRDYVALIFFHHFDFRRLSQQLHDFVETHVEDDVALARRLNLLQQRTVIVAVVELPARTNT